MTTIAAELSIDSRGPCALYIASDSRITWGAPQYWWDSGQKSFASKTSPDIFGYCGSAFFPTQVLNQVTRQIESGILFDSSASADERHGRWLKTIMNSLENSREASVNDFALLHGARDGNGMACSFRLWQSRFNARSKAWEDKEIDLHRDHSHFASITGTGRNKLQRRLEDAVNEDHSRTSRHAFQTLFKSIGEGDDVSSGGAPQIVGIYRVKPAQYFGMIWNNERYFCGCKLVAGANFECVDWFNEQFERCDGKTRKRLAGAKKH